MAPQINRNLERWVERLAKDLTPGGLISRIELMHVLEEGGERLTTIDMESRPADEDAGCIAQELWEEAWEHAETQPEGTAQRYVVRAYRGESQNPEESKSFIINGSCVSSLVGGLSDAPTARGMTAQDMRHNETLHAMVIRLCEASSVSLARQLTTERAEADRLRARIRSDEDQRMEWQRQQASDARLDQLLQMCLSLAPMVVSKLMTPSPMPPSPPAMGGTGSAGRGEPPTSNGPNGHRPNGGAGTEESANVSSAMRDVAVGQVLSTLTKDQIETILSCLDQTQALALMEIYSSFRDEATRKATRKESAQHGEN